MGFSWSLTLEELQHGRAWALRGTQFLLWVHHMQLDLYLLLGGLLFGLYIVLAMLLLIGTSALPRLPIQNTTATGLMYVPSAIDSALIYCFTSHRKGVVSSIIEY